MKIYSLSNIKSHSKVQWKNAVKKAIVTANQNGPLEKAKNYKKIDYLKLSQEKGGIKPYIGDLNVPDARLNFAIRSKMTKRVQMNYKGIEKIKKNHWKCVKCGVLADMAIHISEIRSYLEIRP